MPNRPTPLPEDHVSLGLPLLLRAMRSARGISQRELADRARLPRTTIARLESGRTIDPLMSTVERVVAAAGYRLAVVPSDGALSGEITTADIPGVERDRAGRHLPAHLERRRLTPRTPWWGWGRIAWEYTDHARPQHIYHLRPPPA